MKHRHEKTLLLSRLAAHHIFCVNTISLDVIKQTTSAARKTSEDQFLVRRWKLGSELHVHNVYWTFSTEMTCCEGKPAPYDSIIVRGIYYSTLLRSFIFWLRNLRQFSLLIKREENFTRSNLFTLRYQFTEPFECNSMRENVGERRWRIHKSHTQTCHTKPVTALETFEWNSAAER